MMFTSNGLINVCNRVYLHKPTLIRQLNSFSPGPIFILTKLSEQILFWHRNSLELLWSPSKHPLRLLRREREIHFTPHDLWETEEQYLSPYFKS